LLLILDLAVSGFHDSTVVRVTNALIGLVTVVVAVTVTGLRHRISRWQIATVVTLAVVGLCFGAIQGEFPRGLSAITSAIALAVIMTAAMGEVLDYAEVELQTLYGAMCVYLLLGLFFARVFITLDVLAPAPVFNVTGRLDPTYFSFTTLTTVGYGDITAIGPFARRVAIMEGIAGQVFLATAVARLVSLYRSPGERTSETGAP